MPIGEILNMIYEKTNELEDGDMKDWLSELYIYLTVYRMKINGHFYWESEEERDEFNATM